jgi:signal transduction histidine kinase
LSTRNYKVDKLHQNLSWQNSAEIANAHEKGGFDPMRLLEVAAHDLRNPISGILAAGQFLADDAGSVLDEHHLTLLESIDSSGRAMLRLIDDVIELSHIESGRLRLDIQPTDIRPLLQRALLSNQPAADRKKIKLDLLTAANGPLRALEIDPARIFRAIDGLFANAIKLTRTGGRLEIFTSSRANKAMISLRTDGSSIKASDLRALFNPFKKNRLAKTGVESGTALALARIKRIIEVHGGTIRVQAGEATAWTLQLTLPQSQPAIERRAIAHKAAGAH